MKTKISRLEWIEILKSFEITKELDLAIFQTLYSFENQAAPASEIGKILNYDYRALNLEIGRYAKRISKYYDINFTIRSNKTEKYWDLFFNGWDKNGKFFWQLKEELKEALEETDLTHVEQYAEEINDKYNEILTEGIKKSIIVNSYERNPKARQKCIEHWKAICAVCEFDFFERYGFIGKGFIHVHHIIPISDIGKNYQIDPIRDLIPVCPNCHAMLHRKSPPLEIKELKEIISKK